MRLARLGGAFLKVLDTGSTRNGAELGRLHIQLLNWEAPC